VVLLVKVTQLHRYSYKWTKIDVNVEIWLGNNPVNFHLHTFTRS